MVAVLGPSGSGKTTFIRTVSGHVNQSSYNITGSVISDDQFPLTPKISRYKCNTCQCVMFCLKPLSFSLSQCRNFGYVLQHEKLHPNLTVWEALMFSALLGLPRTLTYKEKKQRVSVRDLSLSYHITYGFLVFGFR